MNQSIRSSEMTALLAALVTAQWFSSTASGFVNACGNAVYLAILPAGLMLALLAWCTCALAPARGLLAVCATHRGLRPFAGAAAVLFLLLAATALRDTLDMLELSLLSRTPRWCTLVFLLPVLLAMGLWGTASVSRTIKLLAPALIALYLLVLVLSVWKQFNFYNFFPLLGGGPVKIGQTALSALSAAAWLPMLWIDRPQLTRPARAGLRGCLWATGLGVVGYMFYALLFPNGSATGAAFPLHRLSESGGLSYAFQRAQALFVFAWLPVQMAAVGAGLCYAVRCLQTVLPVKRPRAYVPACALGIAALAFPAAGTSPAWLRALLQTNAQALLLIPLLLPLLIGRAQERRYEKGEKP